jgi:prolyl oligopeptidase
MKLVRVAVFLAMMIPLFQLLPGIGSISYSQKISYPKTRTTKDVDFYFGKKVFDPYRWLEDIDSPEVQAWVSEQMQLTRSYLDTVPYREFVRKRLYDLRRCDRYNTPERRGGRYFFFKQTGGLNNTEYYVKESLDGKPRSLLNFYRPPVLNEVVIANAFPSPDGKFLAYILSNEDINRAELHFLNVDTAAELSDSLQCDKHIDLVWAPDNSGYYYTGWSASEDKSESGLKKNEKVYWHKLGTPPDSDKVLYRDQSDSEARLWLEATRDSRTIILYKQSSKNFKYSTYYLNSLTDSIFTKLFTSDVERYELIDNIESQLYFSTSFKYPGAKIISINIAKNNSVPKVIFSPEGMEMRYTVMADSHLVIVYMEDAYSHLQILDLSGKFIRNLEMPMPGTIDRIYAEKFDTLLFLNFESYLFPNTAYFYNLNNDSLMLFCPTGLDFDYNSYRTKQFLYESTGGIQVPMFLTYKKDQVIDGNNPTLLYGYGAYGQSIVPEYSPSVLFWLEGGGTYAVANIRGGGEFGNLWHVAGSGPSKQNCFDDFINSARWLIDKRITKPSKLAIMGGSAGGLLVAACLEQHPELFGAVICQAPPTDMLRYPRFTSNGAQTEWGDAKADKYQFQLLRAYSPLHNVDPKEKYPPVLVLAGENDKKVPPLHAYKFIGALQAVDDGEKPKLLRVEKYSGHWISESFELYLREQTDIYTFLFKSLDMDPRVSISPADTTK